MNLVQTLHLVINNNNYYYAKNEHSKFKNLKNNTDIEYYNTTLLLNNSVFMSFDVINEAISTGVM